MAKHRWNVTNRVGVVRAIDEKRSLVLVHLADSERGLVRSVWLPVAVLQAPVFDQAFRHLAMRHHGVETMVADDVLLAGIARRTSQRLCTLSAAHVLRGLARSVPLRSSAILPLVGSGAEQLVGVVRSCLDRDTIRGVQDSVLSDLFQSLLPFQNATMARLAVHVGRLVRADAALTRSLLDEIGRLLLRASVKLAPSPGLTRLARMGDDAGADVADARGHTYEFGTIRSTLFCALSTRRPLWR